MKSIKWVVLLLFATFGKEVYSCSCGEHQLWGMQKMLETDQIFQGKLIGKSELTPDSAALSHWGTYWKYTFELSIPIKNVPDSTSITVFSSTQESACGVNYSIGDELVIFSYLTKNGFWTGYCSGNKHLDRIGVSNQAIIDSFLNSSGSHKWNNEIGRLDSEGAIEYGVAEGEWKYFHYDGSIKSKGYFRNGVKTGEWVYFFDQVKSNEYVRRHPNVRKEEDQTTIQCRVETYKDGVLIDRKSIWD